MITRTGIPTCDITALRSGSMREQARLVLDIGTAAREIGCFSIVNHGVAPTLTNDAFLAARSFFDLPASEKERVSSDGTPHFRGYTRPRFEGAGATAGAFEESFIIGREPSAGDPEQTAGALPAGTNRWPASPDFRATALAYLCALNGLARHIQRAFALDLGMPGDYFVRPVDRPLTSLRMRRYPAGSPPFTAARSGADWGIITLLVPDEAAEFEVRRRDGEWIGVEPVPGAIVCSVGDGLARWSNDRYTSRPHRIVNRSDGPQHSIAFFADPSPETLIACLPTCRDEENPPKYAPISYAAYAQQRSHLPAVSATV